MKTSHFHSSKLILAVLLAFSLTFTFSCSSSEESSDLAYVPTDNSSTENSGTATTDNGTSSASGSTDTTPPTNSENNNTTTSTFSLNVSLSWGTTGQDLDLHSFYFPSWAYGADYTAGTFNPGIRYQVNNQNRTYNGLEIHDKTSKDALGPESHTWRTDVQGSTQKVADGSYLFYAHDNSGVDVDNATLVLKGPGITDNITLGSFSFKNGAAQALNPQAFFFVQVQGNMIKQVTEIAKGTNISVGNFTTHIGTDLSASATQLSTHIGTLDVIQF